MMRTCVDKNAVEEEIGLSETRPRAVFERNFEIIHSFMTEKRHIRYEDYIFSTERRAPRLQIERQLISKALLNLKWTKHISMGCDLTGKGHREDISALDIDDGEEMLIFGSHNGSVSIAKYKNLMRDKSSKKKPISLKLHKQSLKTIKWCPLDLRLFMVSTASGWMRVCDVNMEKCIHGKQFEGDVCFDWNEYNTSNARVAVADGSASMKIVDFRVGMDLPQTMRWDEVPIEVVRWYPSKHHYLYAGRSDGTVGIFDIRSTRGVLAQKKIHRDPILRMQVTPDGSRLISCDRSGYLHVADTWDFSTKSFYRGQFGVDSQRTSDLQIWNGKDLYVITHFDKLTILKFDGNSKTAESKTIEARALCDKPFILRKSSYEIITGFHYNYLNVLSFDPPPETEQ